MKDGRGRVLYVGKSVSLRDRVLGYFRGAEDGRANVTAMMEKVRDVDCVETPSEVDALLAEQRLVKDLHPKYNVDLKDDKSYPYLEIRVRQDFPRVLVSRDAERGSKLYGPFVDAEGLRASHALLQKIFKFRVCGLEISAGDEKRAFNRPCLYYYIGSCLAPCAARVTGKEYGSAIRRLCQFMEGKRLTVVRGLSREMKAASGELDFEKAASVRNQLAAIESLSKRGLLDAGTKVGSLDFDPVKGLAELSEVLGMGEPVRLVEGVDIATLKGSDSVGSVVTFVDGKPFKDGYRRYKIKEVKGMDDYASIGEVVYRRYRRLKRGGTLTADLLLVDGGPGQLRAALAGLERAGARPKAVVSLAKREELIFVEGREGPVALPRTSAGLKVLQAVRDEAHRFARHYHHVLRGKSLFGQKALDVARAARRESRGRRRKR